MPLIILSSGIILCTKSFAGSVNCDRGCFTSIFSDICTNAPVDCTLGYQNAFNFPFSLLAISTPLSAIFKLWLPLCSNSRASSKLRCCFPELSSCAITVGINNPTDSIMRIIRWFRFIFVIRLFREKLTDEKEDCSQTVF